MWEGPLCPDGVGGAPPDRGTKAPPTLASASAACFLPNQMLSPHQIAASGAATKEMPVRPSPSQVRKV